MADLTKIAAMIIDMDGVLWRGETFLPGVSEFFEFLRARSIRFILATNNATTSPERVVSRLTEIGVNIDREEVLTTAAATATFLKDLKPAGSQVFLIGETALQVALEDAGFSITSSHEDADAVVVGFDRELTYIKLAEASFAVAEGAVFVGTNPDPSFPVENGQAPGNGAILAAVQTTTGVEPIIVGKPEPHLYDQASARLDAPPERVLVLGDRLTTDILGAHRSGMASALLLTGVTSKEEAETSSVKPDWVFKDLFQLIGAMAE